jgi:transitional endoplasmic reticulum ATPase
MSISRSPVSRHKPIVDGQRDLVTLLSRRMLLELGGYAELLCGFTHTLDDNVAQSLSMPELLNIKLTIDDLLGELDCFRAEVSAVGIKPVGALKANLARLKNAFGLSKLECQILLAIVCFSTDNGLHAIAKASGKLNFEQYVARLAVLFDVRDSKVRACLVPESKLMQSSIVRLNPLSGAGMEDKILLLPGFAEKLLTKHKSLEKLVYDYVRQARKGQLSKEDYPHVAEKLELLDGYLNAVLPMKTSGVNILLHGEPGMGKTEFASLLADSAGAMLYEVATSDNEGEPLKGAQRFRAYQFGQRFLARRAQAMILFDEVEDVFVSNRLYSGDGSADVGKGWINRLLEDNAVPAIWISNDISSMDAAYLRRFDFVLELNPPPRSVRHRMLETYLAPIGASEPWLRKAAGVASLSPAMISQAARVVGQLHGSLPVDKSLDMVLGAALQAQGASSAALTQCIATSEYDPELVNADIDIEQLVEGFKRRAEGRMCLFGEPGTGKTEFGHYLAGQLDKHLMVFRASDLLGKFVGETEKRIAKMFQRATQDGAVLMIDEADTFLRSRTSAKRNWEVSQINEFLTRMEEFKGVLICSTNLMEDIDPAAHRRFDFKVQFEALTPPQRVGMLQKAMGVSEFEARLPAFDKVRQLDGLTAGDFAAVSRREQLAPGRFCAAKWCQELAVEVSFRSHTQPRRIGFLV